jgi:hypothetical protein
VKYIAKSAAKNINSLDSQTIVPTATKFGRVVLWAGIVALDMVGIIPENGAGGFTTSPFEDVILLEWHESGHRSFAPIFD